MNNTNGIANLAIESNTGGSLKGDDLRLWNLNVSDRRLKENIRRVPDQHLQLFDAVEPQYYDRIGGGKNQLGFIAQDVQPPGSWARSCARP